MKCGIFKCVFLFCFLSNASPFSPTFSGATHSVLLSVQNFESNPEVAKLAIHNQSAPNLPDPCSHCLTLQVNLLTTVLNASPVLPTDVEDGDLDTLEMVRDNPQCVAFGLFMIWFSSITINLGPTFLRCNKIKSIYQNKLSLL